MALLDELLLPRTGAEQAQIDELLAAGVSGHRVRALYPLDLAAYLPGVTALAVRDILYDRMQEEDAVTAIDALFRIHLFFPVEYVNRSEDAAEELKSRPGCPSLLRLIYLLQPLDSHELSELLEDPSSSNTPATAAAILSEMQPVESFIENFCKWGHQELTLSFRDPRTRAARQKLARR